MADPDLVVFHNIDRRALLSVGYPLHRMTDSDFRHRKCYMSFDSTRTPALVSSCTRINKLPCQDIYRHR